MNKIANNYYTSINELIGNTPLLKLQNLEKDLSLHSNIFAKLEFLNPSGSVKDRTALAMINDAKSKNLIDSQTVIIEPTSGNTGIGLASVGAALNLKTVIVMPENVSKERVSILKFLGADVILTDVALGMEGAIKKAFELQNDHPNSFIPSQFDNFANPKIHMKTTGPEIFKALNGEIDFFVAGFGTGGTISGVANYLKSQNDKIQIVGVEPANSPFITLGTKGPHKIQGIGAGFIPKNLNLKNIDRIQPITDESAYESTKAIAQKEGLLVGPSSGAALSAALELAQEPKNKDKNIVVIFPDSGQRYLSTDLF